MPFVEHQRGLLAESNDASVTISVHQGGLSGLAEDELDAAVYGWPNLVSYANVAGLGKVLVIGELLEKQSYSIALSEGSAGRERVNRALLLLKEKGVSQEVYKRWFASSGN